MLEKTYKEHDYKIRRNYLIGATDLESGQEMVFDFEKLNDDEYTNATLASASVPVMFPWTELRGHKLIDSLASGWNVNIISAIEKCLTIVDDPSQVELDVIVMYPYKIGVESANNTHRTISNYYRLREIRNYY